MKHVEMTKAVRIGGKLYDNPTHAAKRWVETAAQNVYGNADHRRDPEPFKPGCRASRSWDWYRKHMIGKRQPRWRLVLPIFERLLK